MIKISIIIPVYNKELYLKRCFDNILSQIKTHEDAYEIVVVDDGSTDSSSSIIKSYAERSKSIRLSATESCHNGVHITFYRM